MSGIAGLKALHVRSFCVCTYVILIDRAKLLSFKDIPFCSPAMSADAHLKVKTLSRHLKGKKGNFLVVRWREKVFQIGRTALERHTGERESLPANFNLLRLAGIWEEAQEEARVGAGHEKFCL